MRNLSLVLVALLFLFASLAAEPVKPSSALSREKLRYDGKSFVQWQEYACTELKPQRCIEALEALAVFGANGYGPEASRTILEVTRRFLVRKKAGLGDEGSKVIEKAESVLLPLGTPALCKLRDWLSDPRPEIRSFAVKLLPWFSGPCPGFLAPALVDIILGKETESAIAAVKTLTKLDETSALFAALKEEGKAKRFVAVLLVMLKRDASWSPLSERAYSPSNALDVLSVLGPQAAPAVPTLLQMLGRDSYDRAKAATALGKIQAEPNRVIPALIKALESRDDGPSTRVCVVQALGRFGSRAKSACPVLEKIVKAHTQPPGKESSSTVRTPFDPAPPRSQGPWEKAPEEKPQVKLAAAMALDQIKGSKDTGGAALLQILADLQDTKARRELLSDLGTPDMASLTPALMKAFRLYPSERLLIATTFGKMGPAAREALPLLTQARRVEDEELRAAANEAIAAIKGKGKAKNR